MNATKNYFKTYSREKHQDYDINMSNMFTSICKGEYVLEKNKLENKGDHGLNNIGVMVNIKKLNEDINQNDERCRGCKESISIEGSFTCQACKIRRNNMKLHDIKEFNPYYMWHIKCIDEDLMVHIMHNMNYNLCPSCFCFICGDDRLDSPLIICPKCEYAAHEDCMKM